MERSGRRASGARGTRRRVAAVALVGVFVVLLTGCFGTGRFVVGYGSGDVPPGTYSTAGTFPGERACLWASYVGRRGWPVAYGNIGARPERQIVTVYRGVNHQRTIESWGCGFWFPVTASTPALSGPPTADKPSGMYRVPTDMAYGTWTTENGSRFCVWARLRDFAGSAAISQLRYGSSDPQTVHLGRSVHGFSTRGCFGGWHRIG